MSANAEPGQAEGLSGDEASIDHDAQSDEESALQWLSEPPPGFGRHLSGFGQVFTLLDGLATERTLQLIQGKPCKDSAELPARSSLQVAFHAHSRTTKHTL